MKLWQRTDLVLDLWTEPSSSCTVQCYYQRTIDSARCFRVFFPSRVPETMIPSEPLVYRCWNHHRVRRLHIPHCEFWQKAQRYLEIDAVMRSVHHGKQCKRLNGKHVRWNHLRYYILMIPIKDQAFGPFWAHSEACGGNLPEAWSAVRAREHLCKNGEGEHCTVSTKECPIEDIGWLHIYIYIYI